MFVKRKQFSNGVQRTSQGLSSMKELGKKPIKDQYSVVLYNSDQIYLDFTLVGT